MLSVFSEMWEYLTDKYFSVNFVGHNYEHIRLTDNSFFSIRAIIIALFLGIIIAAGMTLFQKRTLGDLIRALDREGAHSPETAKTLGELGLLKNAAIRQALKGGHSYGRFVLCAEQEAYVREQREKREAYEAEAAETAKEGKKAPKWKDVPFSVDVSAHRFYIPEDRVYSATSHFDKKGTHPLTFALVVVVCIVLMSVCCLLLPELLEFLDNFIGVMKG